MESVLVKPKEPPPQPQEPEDRWDFRLQNTFSETCFVFLASVKTKLYNRIWAGFPVGAWGRGREGLLLAMPVFQGSQGSERTVPELCWAFICVCRGGRWHQLLCNTIFPSFYAPHATVADAKESSSHVFN